MTLQKFSKSSMLTRKEQRMNLNRFKRMLIYLSFVVCLFSACNLDYASQTISTSIIDSKEKGFFLFEYKMDSLVVRDKKKPFVVKKVWLEKTHTSTMSSLGNESYQTDETFNQVVFELDRGSYFTSGNHDNWIISDEKGDLDRWGGE